MKNMKASKSLRLIAFFLVAIILVCAFGFSADGWQLRDDNINSNINNQIGTPPINNSIDESTEKDEALDSGTPPESPKHYNYLTGEETTAELASLSHTAFVLNTSAPMYGVSNADLIIEFPIEDGSTRLLSFVNDPKGLTKIGTLAKSRDYITNLVTAFGSSLFSSGKDDTVEYAKCNVDEQRIIDSNISNYVYTEFARYTYTSGALVNEAFLSRGYTSAKIERPSPFLFNEEESPIRGTTCFNKISIPYSSVSKTVLSYTSENDAYYFEKNNTKCNDMATGEPLLFANCFVLFADSVIYENQNSTQMVLKTLGEGIGYYFTGGTAKQITWSLSLEGELIFIDENLDRLVINKGKSFISFVKSSQMSDITLS